MTVTRANKITLTETVRELRKMHAGLWRSSYEDDKGQLIGAIIITQGPDTDVVWKTLSEIVAPALKIEIIEGPKEPEMSQALKQAQDAGHELVVTRRGTGKDASSFIVTSGREVTAKVLGAVAILES